MDNVSGLYELLEASARKHPDATALISGEEEITYQLLLEKSDLISQQLKAAEIGNGDRVAICSKKSIGSLSAIFGILKTGAAYIPLDYSAPAERNNYITDNCQTKAVIVHKEQRTIFETDYNFVTELPFDLLLLKNKRSDLKKSGPGLAYILYTSGSTGKPKGVMYTHSSALEFINWSSETFLPQQKDHFSSHAPFHFDLSVFDLFVSIKHAATLVLIDEETAKQPMLLARLISEKKISVWYSTPTILNMLCTFGKIEKYSFENLRLVLFAGEVFPVEQFNKLKQCWSSPDYYNLYGPTETNVCTYYKIQDDTKDPVIFPIGKNCEHYESMITEENELCISGSGIMRGYWENEELNKIVFFQQEHKTWYKTGDIVETDANANLIFKGRKDRMIKRNGYRIEPGEIESVLSRHPAIIENAVVPATDENSGTIITAFVCCTSAEEESVIKMKDYCMKHLPVYMIPNTFIFLKSLPQTPSNKIDYQQLKKLL